MGGGGAAEAATMDVLQLVHHPETLTYLGQAQAHAMDEQLMEVGRIPRQSEKERIPKAGVVDAAAPREGYMGPMGLEVQDLQVDENSSAPSNIVAVAPFPAARTIKPLPSLAMLVPVFYGTWLLCLIGVPVLGTAIAEADITGWTKQAVDVSYLACVWGAGVGVLSCLSTVIFAIEGNPYAAYLDRRLILVSALLGYMVSTAGFTVALNLMYWTREFNVK